MNGSGYGEPLADESLWRKYSSAAPTVEEVEVRAESTDRCARCRPVPELSIQ